MKIPLTPKDIIFSQLKSKFEKTNIVKVLIEYNYQTNETKAKALTNEGKEVILQIEQKEQKLFKNFIAEKIKKGINKNIKLLIVKIDTKEEKFVIFVKEEESNKLIKVDFNL